MSDLIEDILKVRKISLGNHGVNNFPKKQRLNPIFLFWQRNYESTKILRNVGLNFARQDGKNQKENHATKVTKIPKSKRRKYEMNETENIMWTFS